MRILLDSNVLIAAQITDGVCRRLLQYCHDHHTLIISQFIIDEVEAKLVGKFKYSSDLVDDFKEFIRSNFVVVRPVVYSEGISLDPDDDSVLGTAEAGNCDFILTGDRDLLDLKEFRGIGILNPRQFLDSER